MYCRRGASRKTLQWNCLGCCGGGGGRDNPRFTDWPTLRTMDDGILQNVPGPSATIKGGSVRKIQVVKPQPGLCISCGRESASEG